MKIISYYELLGMIKEDKAPNKIKVHLASEPREYRMIFDSGECNYYELIGEVTEDYKYYLSDSYLESMMFDKTIEILDKRIPEKLKMLNANDNSKEAYYENYSKEEISLDIETLQNWINKIIDYLDYLKSKGE